MNKNLVFSLDIGTRTIIGIVGEYFEDEKIKVLGCSIKEHKKRNMHDGQIHDIEGVAKTVREIVEDLEKQVNQKLKIVSIAAAGRALRTKRVFVEKDIIPSRQIKHKDVEVLELEAIQKAQNEINASTNNLRYYSIGHTVVEYYLNGDRIDKLYDHRGDKIAVELLATFLPEVVVESLYSVIEKVGLEIGSITLEPIAAINIAIKEELRLLNLVLIDIGAGTTDIAITKGGQIVAYAMTSTAGDEITEELSRQFLLDFNSSENLKVKLSEQDEHRFTDIVGIDYTMNTSEIIEKLDGIMDKISTEIVEKIMEYNEKAPSAVFLLGGSSQMPGLKELIAEKLDLPEQRVSIRDLSHIDNVVGLEENGPNMITPVGIAMEGGKDITRHFISVNFNGEEIKMFNVENITVSDVLILTKFEPRELLPKRTEDTIYYINGKRMKIKGKEGTVPQILVNGDLGSLQTMITNESKIEIIPSVVEESEDILLYDIVSKEKYIIFEEQKINLIKSIKVNGEFVNEDVRILTNDSIEIDEIQLLETLVLEYGNSIGELLVNGKKESSKYLLKEGDVVTNIISKKTNEESSLTDETIMLEDKMPKIEKEEISKKKETRLKNYIKLIINDEKMKIEHDKEEFIFVDIFDYIDFDLSKLRGKLILTVNDREVGYMDQLKDGDNIKIRWE